MGLIFADLQAADPDSFSRLGAALDNLQSEAQLQSESELGPAHPARVRTSRTYLYLLGYLKKDSKSEEIDNDLVLAAKMFQAEAGLEDSGQLSNSTWLSLADLCQFQSPCPVRKYYEGGAPSKPLMRAIQLRLFSLGLVKDIFSHKQLADNKKTRAEKKLHEGFKRFCDLMVFFDFDDTAPGLGFNPRSVEILLHHDHQTNRLRSRKKGGFVINLSSGNRGLNKKQRKSLVKNYIKNLALIELWLLGYKVRPGQFRAEGSDNRIGDDTLGKALKKFVDDRGLEDHFETRQEILVGPWFFTEVRNIHQEADEAQDEDINPEVLDQLENNKKFQRDLKDTYRRLGSRLFDGIKRIFGWFKKTVKKVFDFLKRSLTNLARLLKVGALKVYNKIKAVVEAVRLGFEFYARPVFPGSDPETIYVRHGRDLDFDVYVNLRASDGRVKNFFGRLAIRTDLFRVACLIVGKLLDLARLILNQPGIVAGWFGLLITLVRLGRWLKGFRALAKINEELLDQLFDLRAVEKAFTA